MRHQEKNMMQTIVVWPPHFNTVATLPCEMQEL